MEDSTSWTDVTVGKAEAISAHGGFATLRWQLSENATRDWARQLRSVAGKSGSVNFVMGSGEPTYMSGPSFEWEVLEGDVVSAHNYVKALVAATNSSYRAELSELERVKAEDAKKQQGDAARLNELQAKLDQLD